MPRSKNIIFFSTKGGVGKTLIASNLAVLLAKENQKVLLIDLDLQVIADTAKMLDLKPRKPMVALLSQLRTAPQDVNKDDFVARTDFGFDFLPVVLKPQQTPHIESERIKEVFELYQDDYNYIIVDAGKVFSETVVQTLNQANLIMLVVTPDVLSISQTKWSIDTLQLLHFPLKMIKLILNRAETSSSISWQEIKLVLPCDIIVRLPSDGKVVMQALNRCVPVVTDSPRAKITLGLQKLAQQLITQPGIFIERQEMGVTLKELTSRETGEFWKTKGMDEPADDSVKPRDEVGEFLQFKQRIHQRLIETLNLKRLDARIFTNPKKLKELREKAEKLLTELLLEEGGSFIPSSEVREKMVKEIMDEALGLGPLEEFLMDEAVTDIMVNNKDEVYIERHGKIEKTNKRFTTNDQVRTIIERIIAPIGRHIDESLPMVDARLTDGSRVNAIIQPLSLTGPTLTIRKFRKERFTIEELITIGTLSSQMGEFLKACVVSRKNIIVSGGTGSGKTTVLNVLSEFVPHNDRIITIEDAAELKLNQEHWIRLESRPPNIEGRGAITIKELFRNTLRMRPDRIIIGECRGVETLDMLQAMNTGHDGSLTTIHANSTHDVLVRLDSMILMSGVELPIRAIREMISSAIDIIVHTARLTDGSRKIIQITEVSGMKDEMHINLQDVFAFRQTGIDSQGNILGKFIPTGYLPTFLEEIRIKGIPLSEDIFKP